MTDATATDATETPASETETARLELAAAVLLGLATVAIAWAAYQANLWGGLQDKALTESANLTTQAIGSYNEAASLISFDQSLFVEIVLQFTRDQASADAADPADTMDVSETIDFLLANMTEEGQAAVNEWFENDLALPFTDEYYDTFYAAGDELFAQSDERFESGSESNTNGDRYVLVSTFLAAVLFFAGISTVLSEPRIRTGFLGLGALMLLGSVIYLLTLPIASL
ncbi:MAG: hypothetical protein AAF567_18500 [Actinomycetota bacterium]